MKKFLLQALAPSWRLPLSRQRGGGVESFCVTFEFPGWNSRLFIILASEERPRNIITYAISNGAHDIVSSISGLGQY